MPSRFVVFLQRALRVVRWALAGELPMRLRHRRLARVQTLAAADELRLGGEAVLIVPFDLGLSSLPSLPAPSSPSLATIAVVLHVDRVEAIAPFVARLRHLPTPPTLFVGITDPAFEGALREAVARVQVASLTIRVVAARPWGAAAGFVAFADVPERFGLVLHLSTTAWTPARSATERALDALLGSRRVVASILAAFEWQPRLGLIAARRSAAGDAETAWGPEFPLARRLAARLGVALTIDAAVAAPTASLWWARGAALAALAQAAASHDAASETLPPAAVCAATERLIVYACEAAGFRWLRAGGDRALAPFERPLRLFAASDVEALASDQLPAVLRIGFRPRSAPNAAAESLRDRCIAQCVADLDDFLRSGERCSFAALAAPKVSVILVLRNRAESTLHCLASLRDAVDVEVVIHDNASTDRTGELLDRLDGVAIHRSPEGLHFVRGANAAAARARGRYLLFLNDDTRVAPGAIAAAAARLDAESDLGAVVGPIVLPNGTLQEAGSIIWRDGSTLGYGRGRDPGEPEFQFRRDVDYGSGAFLMTRRALFDALGGFDPVFAPAYYEDADYAMRLRAHGYRVGYEPQARIMHLEFGGTPRAEVQALVRRNRVTFQARHRATLDAAHHPLGARPLHARARPSQRLLLIDDRVPNLALGSGYPRARRLVQTLADAGWVVTLYPLAVPAVTFAEAYRALPATVEIVAGAGGAALPDFLRERLAFFHAAIVSRPHNAAVFARACAIVPAFRSTPLLYDAEALFAARDLLQADLHGDRVGRVVAERAIATEVALARDADLVLAVGEHEAERFRAADCRDVRLLAHAVTADPGGEGGRAGLLFIGALDDDASPNVDSVVWFVREVMPRLDARFGDAWTLDLIGSATASRLRPLASARVRFLGRLDDVDSYYARARIFIAPTRYAAGIPLKVLEAAAKGVPVVATSLLARQLAWLPGSELLVADDAEAFAAACEQLLRDDALWRRLRAAALAAVQRDADPARFRDALLGAVSAVVR
jgi:GT2 family glycosyltransferase